MKGQLYFLSVCLGLMISCSPKSTSSTTPKTPSTPVVEAPRTEVSISADMISAGKTVYESKCGKCHGLKTTTNYTQERWKEILVYMIPKARLNDDEAKQVTAYVNANAKK